jgi:dTMP kinase
MRTYATNNLDPDLTIYLDIDPVVGLQRATGHGADRIERESIEFHKLVRKGFLAIRHTEPARFKVVDALGSPEEVQDRVLELVMPLFAAQLEKR